MGRKVNMYPFVSIIVPVYNVEKYLEQCIKSLIVQTLQDIEIILVEDVSTDSSREILKKYESQDARINVIYHEKNGGLSAARNTGLRAARGEYVGFVDSDDYVTPDMFEKMYKKCKEFDTDIASCGYRKCDDSNNTLSTHHFPLKPDKYIDSNEMVSLILDAHKLKFIWFVWRNLYKREMLIQYGILFEEEIRFAEDTVFNLHAFYRANGVVVVNEALYFYRENPNSLTGKKSKSYLEENLIKQYTKKIEFYKQVNLLQKADSDLATYVAYHQLPMMLSNAIAGKHSNTIDKFSKILSLIMVKNSLENTKFINKDIPKGIQIVIILSKLKMLRLLKLYLSR